MPHTQRFCVIAQARTGSEYLTTRLNQHPEITCHRELYNAKWVVTALPPAFKARAPSPQEREADPLAALDRIEALSNEAFPRKRVLGFKLFLTHDKVVRKKVRSDHGYRLIVLERENKLAQYVSREIAMKTGQWNAHPDKDAGSQTPDPVEVDLADLARFIEASKKLYARFDERIAGRPGVMHVKTETLDQRFAEVLDFLGVDNTPHLRVMRPRQNPTPLSTRVRNWNAVAAWLEQNGLTAWAAA